MRYKADIDGLRAVAVAAVILYHAGVPGFSGGFVGVDVFLVISGFLIATLLREEAAREGRIALLSFLARRARRLMPLTLVVALATLPFAWAVLLPHYLKDFGQSLAVTPFFAGNILYWREAGYFTPRAVSKPLLHLWSLALEGQFYLFLPLLLMLCRRIGIGWARALAVLAAASFGAGLWAAHARPEAADFLLPFRLWEFLAGALLALWPVRPSGWQAPLGLGLIAASVFAFDNATAFPGLAALLPVAGAALVIAGGGRGPGLLGHPAGAFLGRLSFGLYLWHFPVFVLLRQRFPGLELAPLLPVLLPVLVLLSWASWRFVEQPFRSPGAARRLIPLATAAALVAGAGLHVLQGAPWRLPQAARAPLAHAERWAMPCHDALGVTEIAAGRVCRIGAEGVAPRIALLGDSHAGHLTPALGPALAARGAAALVFSRGWCAPVPGFGTRAPGRGPECAAFMAAAWDALDRHPQIRTLVLAAQWANFTDGARAGHAPVTYCAATRPAENPAAFTAALDALAPRLAGRGAIVIGPVPEYPRTVPDMLAEAAMGRAGPPEALAYGPRNAAALAALGVFATRTGAELLDTRAIFCARVCRGGDGNGAPYYRDEAHLSTLGAGRVVAALLPLLESRVAGGFR